MMETYLHRLKTIKVTFMHLAQAFIQRFITHSIYNTFKGMILVLIVTFSTNQDIEKHLLNLPVKLYRSINKYRLLQKIFYSSSCRLNSKSYVNVKITV